MLLRNTMVFRVFFFAFYSYYDKFAREFLNEYKKKKLHANRLY